MKKIHSLLTVICIFSYCRCVYELPAVHIIIGTDTEYEDALIGKTFVFMFVNSFAALFYIAFVKPFLIVDPCLGPYVYFLST